MFGHAHIVISAKPVSGCERLSPSLPAQLTSCAMQRKAVPAVQAGTRDWPRKASPTKQINDFGLVQLFKTCAANEPTVAREPIPTTVDRGRDSRRRGSSPQASGVQHRCVCNVIIDCGLATREGADDD